MSSVVSLGAHAVTRAASAAPEATRFETKLISDGDNRPSLDLRTDRLISICVDLHRRESLPAIANDLGISTSDLQRRLDALSSEGLIKAAGGSLAPTFLVVTLADARWLSPPTGMVSKLGRLIENRVPEIERRAESIAAIRHGGFARNSLLLLSNVLLDNWQIENVEERFLNAERPLRNGRRYYFSVMEKPASQAEEAFGIYGNASMSLGGIQLGLYGRRRYDGSTLASVPREKLAGLLGLPQGGDIRAGIAALLKNMVTSARTGKPAFDEPQTNCLRQLGLLVNDDLHVTVLSRSEAGALTEVAGLLTNDLLGVLQEHRPELESTYKASPYKVETTFNEFFIWWYHFFYTAVTNWLADRKVITLPPSGNVTYLIAA